MEASRSSHVLGGRLLPPSIRTVAPFVSVLGSPEHVLHKPIQRVFEVANGLIRLTMLHCLVHTVCDMLLQDGFAHLVERGPYGRNLRQHVIALAAFFPQPLQTVGMTSDTREPFGDVLARWIVCQMRHRRHNFLESNPPSPLGRCLAFIWSIPAAVAKSQEEFREIEVSGENCDASVMRERRELREVESLVLSRSFLSLRHAGRAPQARRFRFIMLYLLLFYRSNT